MGGCDTMLAQKTMESEFYRSLAENCDSISANTSQLAGALSAKVEAQSVVIREKDVQLESYGRELKAVQRENSGLKKQRWWIVGVGGAIVAILTGTTISLAK